ncbi:alpha-L-fucosidase [Mucilaginibacter sp. L196]|uniref:alpha-L-fucosidase n=1 Tax=Mucilaginibacter sp. L196 TaxID=1641870 RepID=UPI001C20951A|nr:alpha-L-fucosidase [Mucilaginibacter sp. L196]
MKCYIPLLLILLSINVKAQDKAAWMKQAKFGVMTHYLPDWLSQTENINVNITKWNELIDSFNVNTLADEVKSVGAGYMIFTIGQNSGFYDAPNATYDRLVGNNPSKCSKRDLIADLGAALHNRGLKLIVYLPSGAPNGDQVAKNALEWQNGPHPNKEFQSKWEQIIREWSVRWGDKVDGWWFDGCYWPNIMYRTESAPNFKSFADAARAGNPNSIVAFNMGVFYRLTSGTPYEDYIAGEINKDDMVSINHPYDGKIDGVQIHALSNLGEKWGMGNPRFTVEQIVGYTKKINDAGGAMTWDAPIQSNGEIYPAFITQLIAIGKSVHQ